jgi:hypothetical protein
MGTPVNTELQAPAKSPVELCEVVLVPSYPAEEIHALLHVYDLENLVLLDLMGDAERKVLRDNVVAIVHDEEANILELELAKFHGEVKSAVQGAVRPVT